MKLFQLTLKTLLVRKAWVVALLCVGVLPFVLPVLVPTEFSLGLVQPARAQAAWVLLWLVSIFWMFGQAARQGDSNARQGMGLYFKSMGVNGFRQLFEIWIAHAVILVPLVGVAVLVCCLGARPSDSKEAMSWVVTNLQYAALFLLVVLPLVMLAIALGSRLGALVGYLGSVGVSLYGLYGVGYLDVANKVESNTLIRGLYAVSPHYRLADLTDRLVFKMGHLEWSVFGAIALYMVGLSLMTTAGSCFAFRTTAKS
ncbi:MAG: hypothetical protein Q7Q71_05880 [Verrucomicrobiota bacterium JB023]|nr:hypothetical protein [Verrucomicrobiota bacterium JB023]